MALSTRGAAPGGRRPLPPGASTSSGRNFSRSALPSAASCSTSSQVTGVDTVGSGRARSEYGAIVVLATWFWLQSMRTRPLRSSFFMLATTRSGRARASSWAMVRASSREPGVLPLALAVGLGEGHVELQPLRAARLRVAVPPVLVGHLRGEQRARPPRTRRSWPVRRDRGRRPTGRAPAGRPLRSTCHCGTCSSSAARLATHTMRRRGRRGSRSRRRCGPWPSGWPAHARCAPTSARSSGGASRRRSSGRRRRSGNRRMVRGRSRTWGSSTGAMRT